MHWSVLVFRKVFQLDAAFHETKRGLQLFTTVFWRLASETQPRSLPGASKTSRSFAVPHPKGWV